MSNQDSASNGVAPERVWLFQMAGMDGRWVSTDSESAKANYGVEYVRVSPVTVDKAATPASEMKEKK